MVYNVNVKSSQNSRSCSWALLISGKGIRYENADISDSHSELGSWFVYTVQGKEPVQRQNIQGNSRKQKEEGMKILCFLISIHLQNPCRIV